MHGLQVPLDDAEGQPGFLPQRHHQADQVDPQPLLAHHYPVQLRRRRATPSAARADADNVGVFHNFHRNLGQVNHFPRAVGPAPRQSGRAVGTPLHRVLHPSGGRHAGPGKAARARFAWFPGRRRLTIGFGLQTGHPTRTLGFGPPFQLGNPFFQALDERLLPDDDFDQNLPVGSPEVSLSIHATHIDITDTAHASICHPFRSIHHPSLNSYPPPAVIDKRRPSSYHGAIPLLFGQGAKPPQGGFRIATCRS